MSSIKKISNTANPLFLILLFISGIAYSQKPVLSEDFTFKSSEKYKRIKSLRTYQVASGNRFISIKKGRKDMTIQRFSLKDFKEEVKKRQVIEDKGEFQTVMKLGDKAVVFYTIKDKAFAQKISLTGIVAEKPVQLGNDKENIHKDFGFKGTHGFDAGGRINKFVFKKSFDGNKLLVLFRVKTAGEKPDKIGIAVYDTDLKLLWKRKVTLPYVSDKIQNEDFAIDNNGNFYMTASIFNAADSEKNKLDATYRTEVFKIKRNPKDVIKSEINIPGKSITDAIIKLDASGKVHVSGFYANNDNKLEISGVFTAPLKESGTVAKVAQADISTEVLLDYATKRELNINAGTQKKDDKKDLEDLRVNNVLHQADGSSVIYGEQRYVESFTTSSSSGSRTTYKYYYRDIFVFKLSADGDMSWMHRLPKHQIGARGKRSMSYINFRNDGKHYLFYMDDFVNLKKLVDEVPVKYFDGNKEFIYLTTYIVNDTTGEVSKEPILTGSDLRNSRLDVMELSKVAALPNKDMLFEVYDGKKNNLLLKVSLAK